MNRSMNYPYLTVKHNCIDKDYVRLKVKCMKIDNVNFHTAYLIKFIFGELNINTKIIISKINTSYQTGENPGLLSKF